MVEFAYLAWAVFVGFAMGVAVSRTHRNSQSCHFSETWRTVIRNNDKRIAAIEGKMRRAEADEVLQSFDDVAKRDRPRPIEVSDEVRSIAHRISDRWGRAE